MAHLDRRQVAARQRIRTADQKMDVNKSSAKHLGSVLLTADGLTQAAAATTQGGKKRIDGLYLPTGARVETGALGSVEEGAVINPEAQANLALAKVAAVYNDREERIRRKAARERKTREEVEDMESAKKAQAILDASNELERIQYERLFDFFDTNKDRTWGSIEFAQRMTDIGCATTVENAANLLYFAGVRDVDRITFEDFIQMMPKLKAFRRLLEKDAMRAFAEKDTNGRGWITTKAVREVFLSIAGPEGMDEQDLDRLVKTADRERTGMITFNFFMRALFGTPPVLEYKPQSRTQSLLNSICFCAGKGPDDSDPEDDKAL